MRGSARLFIAIISVGFALSGCSSGKRMEYPEESKAAIRNFCEEMSETSVFKMEACDCGIRQLEENVPFDEFRRDADIGEGKILIDVLVDCADRHFMMTATN